MLTHDMSRSSLSVGPKAGSVNSGGNDKQRETNAMIERPRRVQEEPAYIKVLQWIGVVLVVALSSLLLLQIAVTVALAGSSHWYDTGIKIAGATSALMGLITLVFRVVRTGWQRSQDGYRRRGRK